jgi:hypothetical protein
LYSRYYRDSKCTEIDHIDLSEVIERVNSTVEDCRNRVDNERRHGILNLTSFIQLIQALDDKFCLQLRQEDLDRWVRLCREALSIAQQRQSEPLLYARLSFMLARAIGAGEDRTHPPVRDHSHLDERVSLCRIAINSIPENHVQYLQALSELACALCQKPDLDRCQEAVNLQAKISSHKQFDAHPLRPRFKNNAATFHYLLARASASLPIAQEAVELARRGLEECPKGHIERYRICDTAIRALREAFDITSDASLMRQSIEINRERLDIALQTGQYVFPVYDSFCVSYGLLYDVHGDRDAIERAVEHGNLSVLHTPSDDRYSPMYVINSILVLCPG